MNTVTLYLLRPGTIVSGAEKPFVGHTDAQCRPAHIQEKVSTST